MVLEEKLLKNDLHNGMHRETMLGVSYLLGFFLRNDQVRSFPLKPTGGCPSSMSVITFALHNLPSTS